MICWWTNYKYLHTHAVSWWYFSYWCCYHTWNNCKEVDVCIIIWCTVILITCPSVSLLAVIFVGCYCRCCYVFVCHFADLFISPHQVGLPCSFQYAQSINLRSRIPHAIHISFCFCLFVCLLFCQQDLNTAYRHLNIRKILQMLCTLSRCRFSPDKNNTYHFYPFLGGQYNCTLK